MSEIKTNKTSGAGVSRWLKHVTVGVVVVIAGIAFWISFTALTNLGALAIPAHQSWGLPVIVNGMIITGTLTTVMMRGRESKRPRMYAWAILIGGAVLSVVANALHGAIPADWITPAGVKATIASIPPLGLLLMTHLLVMISRRVVSRWLKHVTVLVVVVIAVIAFWISFTALTDLGALAIPDYQSWGLPVIVDGMIITGTLATVMMRGRESKRPRVYAWAILIGGAVLSVVANALHGAIPADWITPAGVKATITSIPSLGLLLMTYLLVMISQRVEEKKPRRTRRATPAPLPLASAAPASTPATIQATDAQDEAPREPQTPGGPGAGDVPQTAPAAQGVDPAGDLVGWVSVQLGAGIPERSLTRLLVQEAGISESTARRRLNELRDSGQFPNPKQQTSRLRVVAQ